MQQGSIKAQQGQPSKKANPATKQETKHQPTWTKEFVKLRTTK